MGESIENVAVEIDDVLQSLSNRIAQMEVEVAKQRAISQSLLRTNQELKASLLKAATARIEALEKMDAEPEEGDNAE